MSTYMTVNNWWTSFSNWEMVVSTVDARPVRLLFTILVMSVRDIVLMGGGVLSFVF